MKPGEHPEFFRFPAPEGRSRESTLVLDGEGRWTHDGEPVEHPKLAEALHTWIARNPEDGRFILSNGYDWTYCTIEDVPFFVRAIHEEDGDAILVLSDGSQEPLDPSSVRLGKDGAVYLKIAHPHEDPAKKGPFDAKLSRHAQTQLEPFLKEENGTPVLVTKRGKASFSGALS